MATFSAWFIATTWLSFIAVRAARGAVVFSTSDRVAEALTFATDIQLFSARLANVEDKLGKALSEAVPAAGPNAGDTNLQSVYTQLLSFEDLVVATAFDEVIYQNDLLARVQVLRFTLINRVEPSIGLTAQST